MSDGDTEVSEADAPGTTEANETHHPAATVTMNGASLTSPQRSSAPSESTGPALLFSSDVSVGDRLGAYTLVRQLGSGGMGEVYEASREGESGPNVALKILRRSTATNLYRFKREFRALANVEHENLVTLEELIVPSDAAPFFTMELIAGQPFTAYVRAQVPVDEPPNEARLRRCLLQLASGVAHLHAIGCVHRDLKPSNVLVDREGRVVILDFGLVTESSEDDASVTLDGQLLGTPLFMAPEQAMPGASVGRPADLYAVGVMLYECLTGTPAFHGSAVQIMLRKQDAEPPPVRALASAPADLRALCLRLLAADPQLRPTVAEVLEALGQPGGAGPGSSASNASARVPFVGRARELATLEAALRDVAETRAAVSVEIHGDSGLGKSALLTRFASRARRKGATVFAGRCLQRESVPYKGVDAIIDALAVHLRRMSATELAPLRPRRLPALTKIFPVLDGIWGPGLLDAGDEPDPTRGDPAALKRVGVAALAELLHGMAEARPLVVLVDDFQWADVDSARLLASLTRPPSSPPLLAIVTYRHDSGRGGADTVESAALRELADPANREARDVRTLELRPLSHHDARELARALLASSAETGSATDTATTVAAESCARRGRGNPFHIAQLAIAHHSSHDSDASLDRILVHRLSQLEPEARRILATVAVAGGPVPLIVVAELAREAESSVDTSAFDVLVTALCEQGLLVRGSLDAAASGGVDERDQATVEVAHTRIRAVVAEALEGPERAGLHLGLALALERLDADPEALAEHFARGGDRARAAHYTEQDAIAAAEAFAFARSVELYRRTLELLGDDGDRDHRQRVRRALASELVNLGHSGEAADSMLALADEVESVEPADARSLRRDAVKQLLRAGRLDEALPRMAALLGSMMPRDNKAALRRMVYWRVRLALRGMNHVRREDAALDPAVRDRLDTLLGMTIGLSPHDVLLSQALAVQTLYECLEAGEPRRIAMLLTYEYAFQAIVGAHHRAVALHVDTLELAAGVEDLEVDRAMQMSVAMAHFGRSRFRDAARHLARLRERLAGEGGVDWIRGFSTMRLADCWRYLGRLAELRRELPRWIALAREHGNLHEQAVLTAHAADLCLAFGEVEQARAHIDNARETWQPSRFTVNDAVIDLMSISVRIAGGAPDDAFAEIERHRQSLRRAGLLRVPLFSAGLIEATARATARALIQRPADPETLQLARRVARKRTRRMHPLPKSAVLSCRATLASVLGDRRAMARALRELEAHLDDCGFEGQRAAVRLRLAAVTTSDREAAELEDSGQRYLDAQGIPDRAAFLDLMCPLHGLG